MIKYVKQIDNYILDIPELKQLRNDENSFSKNKTNIAIKKQYNQSTIAFFDWYINYCSSILNGRTYVDKQICECIFRSSFKSENQWKEYLLKSIYISKEYVEYLKTKITAINIHKYDHTITTLEIDLEWLIASFEVQYKKTTSKISLNSGRRKIMSPRDIYSAAKTLFFIEEFDNIEDLYLRDLKPAVMFQIRQLLEVFSKNLIGYYTIVDKDGYTVKKFTQIAWDFIKEENKNPNPRIEFPFDIHMILLINTWAQSFVHTTYIFNSYIQFFAIKTIRVLFYSKSKGIKIYTGRIQSKFDISEIKITNYNSLKIDFENYLKGRMPDILVEWMEVDQIGAYIISE
jgi:hypothetical protein